LFNVEYKTHIKSLNYVNFPCIIYDVNLERKVFMFQKLEAVEKRYEELNKLISDPDVISRQNEWKNLMKEHSDLVDIVEKYREYKKVKEAMDEAKEMLSDRDLKELAEMQIEECKEKLPVLEEELKILLIPKDKDDDRNIICEIRGGAGGDEAALFAGTLFRMYSMYAERKHWKLEVLNENETELGGFKEISFMITGKGAYSRFKFESGVHRVQRVPDTESSGRIHTSTATVAVLPVVEDVEIEINPADVRMEVFRASGAGGQHINKTSSAVRMTHLPTGIVVAMQDQRSQQQNREKAMQILKSRVYDYYESQNRDQYDAKRKESVGTGDRSERIRTYNYPQNRVTDHRINFSIMSLDRVMDGELEPVIEALQTEDLRLKLAGESFE